MEEISKGMFVSVGNDIGVVVMLEFENETPEDHLGIWYGEMTDKNIPLYRNVPKEYCIPVEKAESYH
ncbi:MAG: hypothetical protein V2A54_14855 [Bacteroidota bacterium]